MGVQVIPEKPVILPHSHLYAKFFPDDFKGKIVFISRDQRAIIASAYPFLQQIPYYNEFFETWGFKNLDDFARHDVEGKNHRLSDRHISPDTRPCPSPIESDGP